MSKVRVGIIGAGNIAKLHALGYANAPNAELHAVCDVNGERARERAAQWGAAKSYTDYRDLLDDPEVDAVDVITPHHLHARMGVDALAAGKHVSMQKPMAMTVAECDELIAAADRAAGIFRTFENFQYYPPLVRARNILESGAIGEPLSMRMKVTIGTREGWEIPYERWSWRFDPEKGGGGPRHARLRLPHLRAGLLLPRRRREGLLLDQPHDDPARLEDRQPGRGHMEVH